MRQPVVETFTLKHIALTADTDILANHGKKQGE